MKKRILPPVSVFLASAVLFACSSCSTSDISLHRRSADSNGNVYNLHERTELGLSQHSVNILNGRLALSLFQKNTPGLLRILEKEFAEEGNPEILEVMVDVAVTKGCLTSDPDEAFSYYLSGASYSYEYMQRFVCDLRQDEIGLEPGRLFVVLRYNRALGALFEYLRDHQLLTRDSFQFRNAIGENIRFQKPVCKLPFPLNAFKELLVCADFEPKNLNFFSYRFGVGVPLIALPDLAHTNIQDKKLQPQLTIPATAVIHFMKSGDEQIARLARVDVHWADREDTITMNGRTFPLCLDLSTPLAYQMNKPETNLIRFMIHPDQMGYAQGLFLVEPYSPDKIPVVFVHGLMSSPRTWAQLFNTLRNDPVIRKNYQFWFFSYSTGMPVLFSSLKFRESLDAAYEKLAKGNPQAEANFNKMIIAGHSMGGLLTKTTMEETGDVIIWKVFDFDPAELLKSLPEEKRNSLKAALVFSPKKYVTRVVFLATPHKGSDLAGMWFARLGSKLVNLPKDIVDFGSDFLESVNLFSKDKKPVDRLIKTGIDNLSPDDPTLCALAVIPLAPGIPYHSIIGNEDAAGIPSGSDGVVPYESAHLDGAQSELVVKSGHSVHQNPLAALELRRILLLHLKECDKKTPPSKK